MTHERPVRPGLDAAGPVACLAPLREMLELARLIAGEDERAAEGAMEEMARLSGAYADASPVVRKRFDALAAETSLWAAAAVDALESAANGSAPKAAAEALASELSNALGELSRLLSA